MALLTLQPLAQALTGPGRQRTLLAQVFTRCSLPLVLAAGLQRSSGQGHLRPYRQVFPDALEGGLAMPLLLAAEGHRAQAPAVYRY